MCNHMPSQPCSNLWIWKMSNNKGGIHEKYEYTNSKLNDAHGKWYVECEEVIQKGICHSHSAANRSSFCTAVWLELRSLCPVAVHIWPKSLSSSGLSLAELASSAIPSEGQLLEVVLQTAASVPKDNAQCADEDLHKVCMVLHNAHADRHNIYTYIYKYHGISNRPRLLTAFHSFTLAAWQQQGH